MTLEKYQTSYSSPISWIIQYLIYLNKKKKTTTTKEQTLQAINILQPLMLAMEEPKGMSSDKDIRSKLVIWNVLCTWLHFAECLTSCMALHASCQGDVCVPM